VERRPASFTGFGVLAQPNAKPEIVKPEIANPHPQHLVRHFMAKA
jgi:hypothetical protein